MNKKLKPVLISIIVLVILLIVFLPKIFSSRGSETTTPGPGRMNTEIPVTAHIVKYETLSDRIYSTGTVLANEEVELRSETSGKIVKILFSEGRFVNKGDLLVKINDSDLQAQLRKTESNVRLMEDREARAKQLVANQMISQEEYENTFNQLEASKAEYDLIKAQIEKTEIRAPFSGIVGLRSVSEGSFVTTSTVIAKLQNLSAIKVDFSIPQKYAAAVKIGDELEFKLSGSDNKFKAKVYAIEPKIDPSTRTVQIRAISNEKHEGLFPGAFADVELNLREIENAILIPSVSIIPELKGQKVYLYRDGIVQPQNIEVGIRKAENVQITSGLTEGDTVLTSGILQVRPGAKVRITEFN
jgi:membrane fusion protein, multidrug efflux system